MIYSNFHSFTRVIIIWITLPLSHGPPTTLSLPSHRRKGVRQQRQRKLEQRSNEREWLYNMHIVNSKRNKVICHIPNWILSLHNLSGFLRGNSCCWANYEGWMCWKCLRFGEACCHHYTTNELVLQISLLRLPSSLTSHFDLSPLLLLPLPPMDSLIYAMSGLIMNNDL